MTSNFRWMFKVFFVLLATLFLNGCLFKKFGTSEKYNVMGVVTHEKSAFSPVEVGSIKLSSEEVVSRQKFFFRFKTTFLWGLLSFTDY